MNLRLKFILSFLCLSIFVAFPAVYSIVESQKTRENIDKLVHVNIDEIEYSSRINFQIQRIKSNLRELMLENAIDTEEREIKHALKIIKTELIELEKNGLRWRNAILADMIEEEEEEEEEEGLSEELELVELDRLLQSIGKLEFYIHQFIAIYHENPQDINRYQEFFEQNIEPVSRDIQKAVHILHEEAVNEARAEGMEFEDDLLLNEQITTWMVVSVFMLALLLGTVVSIYVTTPLNKLKELSRRVREDNLDERAEILSNDEIGELAKSYNQMLDLIRDNIAKRNEMDQELRDINQTLENRISERTKVLYQAQKDAEAANKVKSQFLSHMSHELRTPLNAIVGFAQLLQFSDKRPLDEKQISQVEHILKNSNYLLGMIEQVLAFNDIERGRIVLQVKALNPAEVVSNCLSMLEIKAKEKNVSFYHHFENKDVFEIKTDETRLEQVLLNIMSNAVKYNKTDGRVDITYVQIADDRLRIMIADTGVGIHPDIQDKLFTPFDRLGHEMGHVEGVGVGLVLAKNIIKKLNGTIGYDPDAVEGATFWIELPLDVSH